MALTVGEKLRNVRKSRKLSLDALSSLTGVSKAMLGQVERGESSPTVATLWKIATGLKVSLSSLLEPSAGLGSKPVLRQFTDAELVETETLHVVVLLPFDPVFGFELFQITVVPGQTHLSDPHNDGVTEHVTVVSGEMEMLVNGCWQVLQTGDVLRFAANQPHGYRNLSEQPAVFHNLIHYR